MRGCQTFSTLAWQLIMVRKGERFISELMDLALASTHNLLQSCWSLTSPQGEVGTRFTATRPTDRRRCRLGKCLFTYRTRELVMIITYCGLAVASLGGHIRRLLSKEFADKHARSLHVRRIPLSL